MSQKIQIAVATHRPFPFALPEGYEKFQVNCCVKGEHWEGYFHDDVGENISAKNESYCELTALYWLWKNSDVDIKGLCHYRRFFCDYADGMFNPSFWVQGKNVKEECMQVSTIHSLLKTNDVITLMPWGPYTRTGREDLLYYCYEKDIDIMTDVIMQNYPEYQMAYNTVMNSRHLSYCNMMIAEKTVFDDYCEWLFSVLAQCEQRCNIESYDVQHKRIYGYLAEVLLNVYIEKNNLKCAYTRGVLVADYCTSESQKDLRLSYASEKVIRLLYRVAGKRFVETLYRKYRPKTYNRYMQYQNCLDQKTK